MGSTRFPDARILLVDDEEANLLLLESILSREGYRELEWTSDPREVFGLYRQFRPDLILLDLSMPYLSGYEVLERLSMLIPDGEYLPVLVLTSEVSRDARYQALSLGARDFLTKPLDRVEVLLRIGNLLETRSLHQRLHDQNQALEERVRERTRDLDEAQVEILERLALAAEYRDDDTARHTRRVGEASAAVARALGLGEYEAELIGRAAPLHDVGKIGVPDVILLKPGRLTPDEFERMKAHTTIGAQILGGGSSEVVRLASKIALTHHERWDGSGYPRGLQGEEIPVAGRLVAVVDVFDALTHDRSYKLAWSVEEAICELERQAGRQFDPRVVEAFLAISSHARAVLA